MPEGLHEEAAGREVVAGTRRLWKSLYRVRLFSSTECRSILAQAESLDAWVPARVIHEGARVLRDFKRKADHIVLEDWRTDASPHAGFRPYLERIECLARSMDDRHLRLGIGGIQEAQLIRYAPDGHYGWHPDAFDHEFRKLTVLCYLNDAASDGLEGGETSFAPPPFSILVRHKRLRRLLERADPDRLGWLPMIQRPRQGQALVFDSLIHHRAHPVRAGAKYAFNVMFE